MVTWCEFGHAAIVTVIVLKSTGASLFLQYISKSNYKLAAHLIPVFEQKTWFEPPVFPTNYLVLPCFAIKTWYVTLCNYKTWNGKISLEPPQSPKNRLNPSHTSTPAGRPRQLPRQTFQRSREAGVLLDLERFVKSIGLVKGINGKSTVATPTLDYLRWSPRNSR